MSHGVNSFKNERIKGMEIGEDKNFIEEKILSLSKKWFKNQAWRGHFIKESETWRTETFIEEYKGFPALLLIYVS